LSYRYAAFGVAALRTELEYGVTDNLQTALYASYSHLGIGLALPLLPGFHVWRRRA
jgi:hypothetical protein